LEMLNPKPVPPYFRVVSEFACSNLSNILFLEPYSIPIPVSFTENRILILFYNF